MSRHLVIRTARPEVSLRLPTRPTILSGILLISLFVALCLATAFGFYAISPLKVVKALVGSGAHLDVFVIREIRLPRVLEGLLVGAALGLSGAIFQSLSRNPLASPDILGINEGAAVVAVWMILQNYPANLIPLGAFGGALGAIAILALLGVRRHFSIYRLMLIGVAINTFAGATVAYLLTRPAPVGRQLAAQQWLFGSLVSATWGSIRILALTLIVLAPLALILGRQLNTFQLGDDLAVSLGIRTTLLQLLLAAVGALLAAVVVAFAGPIGFVAFIAPHIARRLSCTSSAASLPAAIGVGALLVLLADYIAKRILEPTELPVGITTILIGAPYLLFLLYRNERDSGVG
jgi:iron complex transport system permease protein